MGSILFAQEEQHHRKAPEAVEQSYKNEYANYNHSTWDMQNNQWHTRYMDKDHGNRYVDVYYDKEGHRLQSKSRWNRSDLPDAVKDRMRKRYHAQNYTVYRVDKPEKGTYYQISWGNRKIYLDETGHEIKH
jgi:hypothetical protein